MAFVDPTSSLAASGNLRRRQRVSTIMGGASAAAAILAVAILALVIFSVLRQGLSAINLDFLTKDPTVGFALPGQVVHSGIAPAILGSALLVAFATLMALPIGVLIALYVSEFAKPRAARPISLALDLLNGLPSIVIGVFVFALLVVGHQQTGFAGSFALAIIMLPLIARSTIEVLSLVPQTQRDAAHALGVSHWRTTFGIVLPAALPGILTGTVLAVARAAGETAPLILLCADFGNTATLNIFGAALPNIPVSIFTFSQSAEPGDHAKAWGAALVLMTFILLASVTARALLARSRRGMSR